MRFEVFICSPLFLCFEDSSDYSWSLLVTSISIANWFSLLFFLLTFFKESSFYFNWMQAFLRCIFLLFIDLWKEFFSLDLNLIDLFNFIIPVDFWQENNFHEAFSFAECFFLFGLFYWVWVWFDYFFVCFLGLVSKFKEDSLSLNPP